MLHSSKSGKLICVILMFAMLCMTILPAAADAGKIKCPYQDVTSDDWFYEDVMYIVEVSQNSLNEGEGIIYNDNLYPHNLVTRIEFIEFLWSMAGRPESETNHSFADIEPGKWYFNSASIEWAYSQGFIEGNENNCFEPERYITREEMAVILYRYLNKLGIDTTEKAELNDYNDADNVSTWACDAVSCAIANDIIKGRTNKIIDPDKPATKAEVFAVYHRFDLLTD